MTKGYAVDRATAAGMVAMALGSLAGCTAPANEPRPGPPHCVVRVRVIDHVTLAEGTVGIYEVVNVGDGTCDLRAFPALSFTREGRPVTVSVKEDPSGRGARTLGPGRSANFQLKWDPRGCPDQAVADTVGVRVSDGGDVVPAEDPAGPGRLGPLVLCHREARVSDLVLQR